MKGSSMRRAVAPALLVFVLVACAADAGVTSVEDGSSLAASVPASVADVRAWLAVIDTAADPSNLDDGRAAILSTLGDALEGSIVISPAGCFDGLPAIFDPGGYVLAIQESERAFVRTLARQLDGDPLFVGPVTVTCSD